MRIFIVCKKLNTGNENRQRKTQFTLPINCTARTHTYSAYARITLSQPQITSYNKSRHITNRAKYGHITNPGHFSAGYGHITNLSVCASLLIFGGEVYRGGGKSPELLYPLNPVLAL